MRSRTLFVSAMTPLATLFGCAIAAWRLSGQGDLIADLAKIALMLFVATLASSYLVWSLVHGIRGSRLRGALAGAVVGALIVPLPFFAWTLKTGLILDGFGALVPSLGAAIEAGLWTFEEMTRASLAAILGSAAVGTVVSAQGSAVS